MPAEITIKRDQWENNITPLSASNLNVMLNQIVENMDQLETRATKEELQHAKDLAEDAQAAADSLADYVGTFTASEGVDTVIKYIDTEVTNTNTFRTDIEIVNPLGGIKAGDNLDGKSTQEILTQLLYPYVQFVLGNTSRTAAATTLEYGDTQTLSSASISITKKSKPITSVKLLNGSTELGEKTGDAVANGGNITFNDFTAITVSKGNNPNLKFTVTDGETSLSKNVGASTFVYPYYIGKCAANAAIDQTLIKGLDKKIETEKDQTVTYTCANEHMIFAYPHSYGSLKSILDPSSFEMLGSFDVHEISVTGLDGTAQLYDVYVSDATNVTNFKVQFKF